MTSFDAVHALFMRHAMSPSDLGVVMAPEILANVQIDDYHINVINPLIEYDFSVDVYSYGVVMWEILCRCLTKEIHSVFTVPNLEHNL